MDELGLFTAALGLSAPGRVTRTEFDGAQLDLYLDFSRGVRFACPAKDCAQGACPVHDTADKTWRHLDFFQYKALLHARLPRVLCPEHGAGASQCVLGTSGVGVFDAVSRRWR
jgi:transposase